MLVITDTFIIPMREIHFSFIRASGPGGQHVNRSATAVQLRFDVQNSPSLSAGIKNRLRRLAGSRLSKEGVLTIEAQEYRSQKRNREEAVQRLARLLRLAAMRPKARRPTRPTMAAKQRRLAVKKRRSLTKQSRGTRGAEE